MVHESYSYFFIGGGGWGYNLRLYLCQSIKIKSTIIGYCLQIKYETKVLDKTIVDSKVIQGKEEICGKFNEFFDNIGPKLATQIKPTSNKTYDTFLKKRALVSFDFTLVTENDVLKYLSFLCTKTLLALMEFPLNFQKS